MGGVGKDKIKTAVGRFLFLFPDIDSHIVCNQKRVASMRSVAMVSPAKMLRFYLLLCFCGL